MIELPEGLTLAAQLNETVKGKTVKRVHPPSSPHKFCWYNGDADAYDGMLCGRTVEGATSFGIYVELGFGDGYRLAVNDGVNLRLLTPESPRPAKHQLLIDFTDNSSLGFTVAMYGGIICHSGDYDNAYYLKSRESLSPLDDRFDRGIFAQLLESVKPTLSVKAFLATEQRIPGLGNGTLQDILLTAGLHPKRKLNSLSEREQDALFASVKSVLQRMTDEGGRNTERDLFGNDGGYQTMLSKNTLMIGCPRCGGPIIKEAYLGGSVYYCPVCQPLGS